MGSKLLTQSGKVSGNFIDKSGTLGSTNVLVSVAKTRIYLRITAPATNTGSLWWNEGIAAVTASPSMEILKGGSEVFEGGFIPSGDINIIGTSGDKYTIKEA